MNDEGKNELRAYLSLVENFAPFMRSGVVDTINTGDPKQDDLQKQKDLSDIKNYAAVFKEQGFSKNEVMETLLNMPMYSYLRDEIITIVEELNDK